MKTLSALILAVLLTAVPGFARTASTQDEAVESWPREIDTERGLVVLYQPQLDTLEGPAMAARMAVSVTPSGQSAPVFGAVWLEARIETDLDTRTVEILEVTVPRVRFPEATDEQEQSLAALLTREIPSWNMSLSLDRLAAMLDLAESRRMIAEGLDDTPPKIQFVNYAAILVSIDGEPQYRDIEGSTTLKHVVNTPFLMIFSPRGGYYLYAGDENWYASSQVMGPWASTTSVPSDVAALAPIEQEKEAAREAQALAEEEGVEPEEGPSQPPAIVVTTEPMELIVTLGDPEWGPVGEGALLSVTNTESDVLLEVATQEYFVLLSGRWFKSKSLDGPWSFVAGDALPASFQGIPADSDLGHLRTWVAGTEEAEEAVLAASIPQTSAIKRDATIQVTYDGDPRFEPIEETSLHYAVNSEFQVIRTADNRFYCAYEGAWYEASQPLGPWSVATEVPDEIQRIPASSSLYNVKYVYVYDSTPEVVYVGYYPGYVHSYVYHGAVIYGTGYYYHPWWGTYYYPRVSTWGFHVRWNPWYGWGFGLSYSTGRFTFGIGFGGRHGWWGPRGYRRSYHGYSRGYRRGVRAGYRAGSRDSRYRNQNIYRTRGNQGRNVASTRARSSGAQPRTSTTRANNVATDRSGNVAQRSSAGSWQSRAGSAPTRSSTQSYNRTQAARQSGTARTQRSRGGRGGGGRRR